jgi:leucyl/phenylalanyl-tRNA---protein transferase
MERKKSNINFILGPNDPFPDLDTASPDGMLAMSAHLGFERLLNAYDNGIFPWYNPGDPVFWYAPPERCVIFPGDIHISSSMKKIIRQNKFSIRINTAFKEVIRACKTISRKDQHGTWITDEMEEAYIMLHEKGHAHSIEAWQGNELAGGMYGVEVNKVFCGESMFSKQPNASKLVMIYLCKESGYRLLDCQLPNPHLKSMGATMISRDAFLRILHE